MKTIQTALLTAAVATASFAGFAGTATATSLIEDNLTNPTEAVTQNIVSKTDESSQVSQPTLVSQVSSEVFIECVIWGRCDGPYYGPYYY